MGRWWDALRPSRGAGTGGIGGAPRPASDEMKELLARSHDKLGAMVVGGADVPLIILDRDEMRDFVARCKGRMSLGKGMSVNTNLNILHDGLGHVFVEVVMSSDDAAGREPGESAGGAAGQRTLKVLINANRDLEFFRKLAESGMLALDSGAGDGVFMIQLPRRDHALKALDIIEDGLAANDGR